MERTVYLEQRHSGLLGAGYPILVCAELQQQEDVPDVPEGANWEEVQDWLVYCEVYHGDIESLNNFYMWLMDLHSDEPEQFA